MTGNPALNLGLQSSKKKNLNFTKSETGFHLHLSVNVSELNVGLGSAAVLSGIGQRCDPRRAGYLSAFLVVCLTQSTSLSSYFFSPHSVAPFSRIFTSPLCCHSASIHQHPSCTHTFPTCPSDEACLYSPSSALQHRTDTSPFMSRQIGNAA